MKLSSLLPSALIGAVASARSMTPMATISAARLAHRHTTGNLVLLDRPLFKYGALAMGVGELLGDKMKTAPDRTVFLGLLARVASAGIAGAALAPEGKEKTGAAVATLASNPKKTVRSGAVFILSPSSSPAPIANAPYLNSGRSKSTSFPVV